MLKLMGKKIFTTLLSKLCLSDKVYEVHISCFSCFVVVVVVVCLCFSL